MPELLNPYIAGAPVTEASMFFGRQDVFDWIEHSLAGKYVDHILVIHGQRRVGKTSVLKQIPHHLPNRYIQVYLDLQGRAMSSLDRFLWWMSREILRSLRVQTGVTVSAPEQAAFTADADYFHNHFLPAISSLLQDRILLLTFDEFDILSQQETMQSLGRSLTDYLNRLFELENLNFIFSIGSSGKKLENMQAAYTEFFKAALYKKISFLEQADCYRLVTQPVMGTLSYDPGAVQRIYKITSGHPYYTQLICHELFSACQKEHKSRITSADVEAVLPDVIERGTVNLKFIWDEAADLEKWVLASLADDDSIATIGALAAGLDRQHVRYSQADLNSALLHLQEKDVLRANYGFVVQLLRLWLQENRPLGRVREELVEINPIADRFIEIGDEYRDRGSPPDAIQSYQQALSVDPENLRARVCMAAVYLAQADYAQAAGSYARALEIDPEDVQARSGFCEAHLELGEDALAQGDTSGAIDHLRRVVDVNPDHVEVRQRLADILCQQADQMLAQGRDEDALKAIHTAHGYAPEDETLQARYDQVCSQVKGRVLSGLLERASAEWKRQNWSAAIACLEDYLEFEPDSSEVRLRLGDLRHQQHQHQLGSLKTQAKELEKAERWDEAIAAWQDYIDLEPADRPQAEAAIQAAGRYRALADSYAQAQEALRHKEFSRAIPLLQGIIAQEPSYKDTARLLAETIVKERARRPIWKQRWVWAALVFVILFAVSAVFGPRALNAFSARRSPTAPTQVAVAPQPTQTTTPPVQPTGIAATAASALVTQPTGAASKSTAAPTPSATAEPAWFAAFGQPASIYMTSHAPDFSDDFSEIKSGWQLTSWSESQGKNTLNYSDHVTDGALRLVKPPGENISLRSSSINASDFALQFDLIVERGGDANPAIAFRSSAAGSYELTLSVVASNLNQNWAINKHSQAGSEILVQDYSSAVRYQKSMKVLLLAHGDQIAVYFNGKPEGYVQDGASAGGNISLEFAGGYGGGVENQFVLDNLSFWKLPEELPLSPTPTPAESVSLPTATESNLPIWAQTFAEPLLDSISDRPPDFEDDFSKVKPGWIMSQDPGHPEIKSVEDHVKDGVFRFDNTKETKFKSLYANGIQARDFILQFDLSAENYASPEREQFSFMKKNIFGFRVDPLNDECHLGQWNTSYYFEERPCISGRWNETHQITLFSSGDRFGVYIDGEPWGYVSGVPETGLNNYFRLGGWHNQATYVMDNLKFWNLDSQ